MAGIVVVWASVGMAKSYSIERIAIDAGIRADGTLDITEQITYKFDGSFSFAFRDIPLAQDESITDIRVFESGRQYNESSNKSPRTFTVTQGASGVNVTWYYQATDEELTFRFTYTLRGVVKRFSDMAELYYKFVGDGWDRRIRDVRVSVRVPGANGVGRGARVGRECQPIPQGCPATSRAAQSRTGDVVVKDGEVPAAVDHRRYCRLTFLDADFSQTRLATQSHIQAPTRRPAQQPYSRGPGLSYVQAGWRVGHRCHADRSGGSRLLHDS